MRKCPNCTNVVQDDAVFCDQCGTRLPATAPAESAPSAAAQTAPAQAAPASTPATVAQEIEPTDAVCSACGTHNLPGEAFCQNCGAKLEAPQPTAGPAAAPATAAPSANACPDCGAVVGADEEFCFACGVDLKAARARASAQAGATAPAPEVTTQPAAPAAPAQPAQPAPAQAAAPAEAACPTCGAKVKAGDTFCEACGAALNAAPTAPAVAAPLTAPAAASTAPAIAPRLIVVASGVELPFGGRNEIVVGREDPYSGVFPDVDLTPHGGVEGGVSRRHLKITLAGGSYVIEDLNSTNFTMVNRKRLPAGTQQPLADGDEVTAGRVKLIFKVNA